MRKPFIVRSLADAEGLATELLVHSEFEEHPVGFDVETLSCDPKKQSPVERARVWCASFAWGQPRPEDQVGPSDFFTAWSPVEYLAPLRRWFENHRYLKATTNGFGYERHAMLNMGVELRGIASCTSALSRLLNPGKNGGHGLKQCGERLGYHTVEYNEVVGIARAGSEQKPKTKLVGRGKKSMPVECGEHSIVHWEHPELDWLWENKPERRDLIVRYSVQDSCMSLDVHWALMRQLLELRWAA